MKKITNPLARAMATVKKTVDYAKAYPESFRPGTESYIFYEKMSSICTIGLETMTSKEEAKPLLKILELFAETNRPEAKAYYAAWLFTPEKEWYNPLVAKIMLMHAIEDIDDSNPYA